MSTGWSMPLYMVSGGNLYRGWRLQCLKCHANDSKKYFSLNPRMSTFWFTRELNGWNTEKYIHMPRALFYTPYFFPRAFSLKTVSTVPLLLQHPEETVLPESWGMTRHLPPTLCALPRNGWNMVENVICK
jgi:hypothetical protein